MTMTKFSRINKQREEITMRVLEDMEKGGNEWKKPWVEASPLPPHNPVSGTQYSGRNFLYTYVYGMMRGYADPRWATEKQIKEMGWKIPENLQNGRGGINDELGVGIEHWGMYAYIPRVKKDGTPLTDKGGTQKFTRVRAVKENGVWGRYRKGDNGKYEFEQLPSGVHPHPECDRYFKVFNLSLIEGVPPLPVPDLAPNDDIEVGLLADDVIASSRCEVFEGSTDGAYYNFVNDKISVPSREAFNSNSSFLASLLHEMGHSTAPALDRQMTSGATGWSSRCRGSWIKSRIWMQRRRKVPIRCSPRHSIRLTPSQPMLRLICCASIRIAMHPDAMPSPRRSMRCPVNHSTPIS